jgi:tyrosyl-tRNA synthetase
MAARTIIDELQERGIINQHDHDGTKMLAITNDSGLREYLATGSRSIYIGFDPTATSLHVGSMLPALTLARFQRAGHKPIVLVGGATGMIGDPSGRSTERQFLTEESLQANLDGIRKQLEKFVSFEGENAAIVVNNYDWTSKMSYIDWLREVGKHFTVNYMIAKESVRSRLEDRDQGISYTEFSYMLLQAYDFYHLFKENDCRIQGGGSDQWGNITAGTELIRRKTGEEAFGITYPLVETASGEKFGKSAGNAVWIDPEQTSPYAFYQYWLNTNDADVDKFLKFFTFLSLEEIAAICEEHNAAPERRHGQKTLASEVTKMVHDDAGLDAALRATKVLFGSSLEGLTEKELGEIFKDVPSTSVARSRLSDGLSFVDLVAETGMCKSKGEARRLLKGGGLSINNEKITDTELTLTADHLASESLMILRSGKKKYHLVRFTD